MSFDAKKGLDIAKPKGTVAVVSLSTDRELALESCEMLHSSLNCDLHSIKISSTYLWSNFHIHGRCLFSFS